MGERTSHAPGTFSWVDLATTDAEGAKAFYSGLFGWEVEDMPVGDGSTYSMARKDGQYVAAMSKQRDEEAAMGIPPHWNVYVTVDDVDAAAAKASDAGGNVILPPFDVLEAGRMAVVQDPTGAFFMMWQPRDHIGAGLVNAPGALVWNDLVTADPDAAKAFYAELFGWTYEDLPEAGAGGGYQAIRNGQSLNGGIRQAPPEQAAHPPYWSTTFACEDVDATLEQAAAAGGNVLMPGMDMGSVGRFGLVQDPQGAAFAVYTGRLDD
jgi:predicted enzyme related to lactoylglutathione lyase